MGISKINLSSLPHFILHFLADRRTYILFFLNNKCLGKVNFDTTGTPDPMFLNTMNSMEVIGLKSVEGARLDITLPGRNDSYSLYR